MSYSPVSNASSRGSQYFRSEVSQDGFQDLDDSFKPLSWRDDAHESLSDWTIVANTAKESRTYHIHRAIVGAGSRRCY